MSNQKQKAVTVIMGQDCERFIGMCLESVKAADAIVYLDGGSTDDTLDIVKKYKEKSNNNFSIIHHEYDQMDKMMNGRQRNIYLNLVKEKYPDWWCLALDADEIVEDLSKIKSIINHLPEGVYSVKMRHLIGDLAHEDARYEKHFVPNRLFKISAAGEYPEVEHPILKPIEGTKVGAVENTTIWHLAYVPNMWMFKQRYDNQVKKSDMHSPRFLKEWYYSHLFGKYPVKKFNPAELPQILLNKFGIDKDELYFNGRGLELKHFLDAGHWKEFFKPKKVYEFGCGLGPRVYAMDQTGLDAFGWDISNYAVNNAIHKNVAQLDITKEIDSTLKADLVIAYDILEHISYEDLGMAINNLIESSEKNILISIPVVGDPNLLKDSTHIIKEKKEWWIKQFTDKGCKLIPTPDHFLFKDQVIIFEVKND